ncbi:hypothetical protein ABZP36_006980 [Zizania latifolia]
MQVNSIVKTGGRSTNSGNHPFRELQNPVRRRDVGFHGIPFFPSEKLKTIPRIRDCFGIFRAGVTSDHSETSVNEVDPHRAVHVEAQDSQDAMSLSGISIWITTGKRKRPGKVWPGTPTGLFCGVLCLFDHFTNGPSDA